MRLGRGARFAWAGLIRLRGLPDLHEQDFLVLLRKSGNQANYTFCNLLNFLWVPFSLKEPPNVLDYYKFDWKK